MKKIFAVFRKYFLLPLAFVLLLHGLVSCTEAPPKKPIRGKLALTSSPAGASITIAGKTFPKQTPLKLNIPQGIYIVKFHLAGHEPQWKKIQIKNGVETSLSADLRPLTTTMLVSAKADGAFGVQVTYKGKLLGETPLVIQNIPMGKGDITLSKKGYSSRLFSFEAKDAAPLPPADLELTSNLGTLAITTSPAGAKVYLNGEVFGTTPLEEKLEEGSYRLVFRKEGYEDRQKIVQVTRRTLNKLRPVVLRMKKSSLLVTTKPAGAKVILNGESFGSSPRTFRELSPQKYTVRVEKEGFDADERHITLAPGTLEKIHFDLDTNMGGLDLVTIPAGLTVYIDGKSYGKTRQDPDNPGISEVMQVRNLSMGKHTIRISHKRARRPKGGTLVKEVIVRKGKIERVENLSLWIPNTRLHMKNGRIIDGRLHYQNEKRVNFESYPGIKADRLKEDIRKIEPIPLEE